MIDQLPSSDKLDTLPSNWTNYEINIVIPISRTHSLKFQGVDLTSHESIAITDISFNLALSGITITPPTSTNLIQNSSFYNPQIGDNSLLGGNAMSRVGISISYWNIPALKAV